MSTNTPRGFHFVRAAIAGLTDVGELGKLRAFVREQWGDDLEVCAQLEALLDQREAELEGRVGTQLPLPLDHDGDTSEGLDRDAG